MLIMVVSLLLSITICNVLHAAEGKRMYDRPVTLTREFKCRPVEPITSLAEIEERQKNVIFWANIDLKVFDEYAEREGLIIGSKPGLLERIICCRLRKESRFEDASHQLCDEFGKGIIAVHRLRNDQTEASTSNEFRGPEGDCRTVDGNQTSEDDSVHIMINSDEFEKTKQENEKLTRTNERLKKQHELNDKMRKFLAKEKRFDDIEDKYKGCFCCFVFAACAFIGGMSFVFI